MSIRRFLLPVILTAAPILSSCEPCYTQVSRYCDSSEAVTATVPPRITGGQCRQTAGWNGSDELSFNELCEGSNFGYAISVHFPATAGPVTYTLPSPQIRIEADLYAYPASDLSTTDSSIGVTSGTFTVNSLGTDRVDADVDIELDTPTGEHASLVGHVTESNCVQVTAHVCDD